MIQTLLFRKHLTYLRGPLHCDNGVASQQQLNYQKELSTLPPHMTPPLSNYIHVLTTVFLDSPTELKVVVKKSSNRQTVVVEFLLGT